MNMQLEFAAPVVLAVLTAITSFLVAGAIAFLVTARRARTRERRDRQRDLLLQGLRLLDEHRRREMQADAA